MKVAILFADFGPYHIARIEKLAEVLKEAGHELIAYRFCDHSGTYGWVTGLPKGIESERLIGIPPVSMKDALKIGWNLGRSLLRRKVDCILLPSYSPLPNTVSFIVSKLVRVRLVLMSDSWKMTERAGRLRSWLKRVFVRQFDAAFVAGTPQVDYVHGLGMPRSRISCGYDVVDVDYFAAQAGKWTALPSHELPIPNLPRRYFLNLGRFVEKKNLSMLIDAYAGFCDSNHGVNIPLVLVGEGPMKKDLVARCQLRGLVIREGTSLEALNPDNTPRLVVIYPFQQIALTPLFYARCEAFILPSNQDEWGLVINEAQACGCPVIVSSRAGCAFDLVKPDENGYVISPDDAAGLSKLLSGFAADSSLRNRLGKGGLLESRNWTTNRFAAGAMQAIVAATRGDWRSGVNS